MEVGILELVKLIADNGLTIVLAVLFIRYSNTNLKDYRELAKQNSATSNTIKDLVKSLSDLIRTVDGLAESFKHSQDLYTVTQSDVKEIQQRLYLHDDKCEKIITMTYVHERLLEQILANQVGLTEAKEQIVDIKNKTKKLDNEQIHERLDLNS